MIKSVVPAVAKELGKSPAFLLNQLKTLMGSLNSKKIYRTDKQLVCDMEGLIGLATVSRAKKKLVEEGYVIISFDGHLNRQTYYTFTDKAINALAEYKVKNEAIFKLSDGSYPVITVNKAEETHTENKTSNPSGVEAVSIGVKPQEAPILPETPKETVCTVKTTENKRANKTPNYTYSTPEKQYSNPVVKEESALASTTAMREAFEEGFANKNAVAMPTMSLRELRKTQTTKDSVKQDKTGANTTTTNTSHDSVSSMSFKERLLAFQAEKQKEANNMKKTSPVVEESQEETNSIASGVIADDGLPMFVNEQQDNDVFGITHTEQHDTEYWAEQDAMDAWMNSNQVQY